MHHFTMQTKMKTTQLSQAIKLSLACLALFSCFYIQSSKQAALAQEANFVQSSPIPKFSLKAEVADSFLNPVTSRFQKQAILTPAALAAQGNYKTQAPLAMPKVAETPAHPARQDRPNSYLEEYNVNWSPWMQDLASRWHKVLRDSEELLGLQFHTLRPALIQFTCYADGHIGNVFLIQSSGIPVYDRMQILSLMEVAPLYPFPRGTQKQSVTLIQGWESHTRRPGEGDFNSRAFAARFPQEKVSRWVQGQ